MIRFHVIGENPYEDFTDQELIDEIEFLREGDVKSVQMIIAEACCLWALVNELQIRKMINLK